MIRNQYNYLKPFVQKGKKDALKATTLQSKHYKQKAKRTVSPQNNGQNKKFIRLYIQRHTMTEIVNQSRSTALERSVKTLLGGFNLFYMTITLALLSSAMVYTRHLFSPGEGFVTHQCNMSENIKTKRIQR